MSPRDVSRTHGTTSLMGQASSGEEASANQNDPAYDAANVALPFLACGPGPRTQDLGPKRRQSHLHMVSDEALRPRLCVHSKSARRRRIPARCQLHLNRDVRREASLA